ncbi:MAG: metal ABC transporter ATP-binding protein [Caldimicrobium sp.]|jgi:zinc transport system ATP-binding protein
MIQVENLSFFQNGKKILEDISLEIEKGDFLAIIGPNGGGKTTLIKCLLGFIKPQKGKIYLWGKELSNFKDWHLIGYVPQRAGKDLNPMFPLTLREFLHLPALLYKKNLDENYLEELLEIFGLTELLERRITSFSFGQLQRAYIARALVLKPEVLILDEPSVGLDFISQKTFYEILSNFHKKDLTIILVTHETWLLTKEINKVACLNQKLYFHGSHEDFCIFSEKNLASFYFHKIEHTHW